MNCKRCGTPLTGKQSSYCSANCSKLDLKRLYRIRNREKILIYNRQYKAQGLRPLSTNRKPAILEHFNGRCARCYGTEKLEIHHWQPLRLGGSNYNTNLSVFCKKCHARVHRYFDVNFWKADTAEISIRQISY